MGGFEGQRPYTVKEYIAKQATLLCKAMDGLEQRIQSHHLPPTKATTPDPAGALEGWSEHEGGEVEGVDAAPAMEYLQRGGPVQHGAQLPSDWLEQPVQVPDIQSPDTRDATGMEVMYEVQQPDECEGTRGQQTRDEEMATPSTKRYKKSELEGRSTMTRTPGGQHFVSINIPSPPSQGQLPLQQLTYPHTIQQNPGPVHQHANLPQLQRTLHGPTPNQPLQTTSAMQRVNPRPQNHQPPPHMPSQPPLLTAAPHQWHLHRLPPSQLANAPMGTAAPMDMGLVEPFTAALQPSIHANPAMASAFAATAGASFAMAHGHGSPNMDPRLVHSMMQYMQHMVDNATQTIIAAVCGNQDAVGGVGDVVGGGERAGRVRAGEGGADEGASTGGGGGTQGATGGAIRVAAGGGGAARGAEVAGFPKLGTFRSLESLATWYAETPNTHSSSNGRTPMAMEENGEHAWRGGKDKKHQRWSEYKVLFGAITQQVVALTSERGRPVSFVEAARHCDELRKSTQNQKTPTAELTVCQYMLHLKNMT